MLLLSACTPSAAEAMHRAQDPGLSLAERLAWCGRSGASADACATELLRRSPDADTAACAAIRSETWRAECSFAVAERHARAGQRWEALTACGQAGRFYQECLYHAWTYEIQANVRGGGRAADELDSGRRIVAFWSQIGTVGPDPEAQVWLDWWFFTLNRNPPADLADCAALSEPDASRCHTGTLSFVERAVATSLRESGLTARRKSRLCRGDILEIEAQFPTLYRTDDALRARALAGRDRACAAAAGTERRYPWNPIFLENRRWSAG